MIKFELQQNLKNISVKITTYSAFYGGCGGFNKGTYKFKVQSLPAPQYEHNRTPPPSCAHSVTINCTVKKKKTQQQLDFHMCVYVVGWVRWWVRGWVSVYSRRRLCASICTPECECSLFVY